jgi:Tfp pilus assembly protein PilO
VSYALRNTLIIGAFLALILTGGAYWTISRLPGELDALKEKEKEKKAYLDQLNRTYVDHEVTRTKLEALKSEWHSRTKIVPTDRSPASLFAYLSQLLSLDRSDVDFDFTFAHLVDKKDYGYVVCSLTGVARFRDLYNLLWRLENERRLVKIEGFGMREKQIEGDKGEKAQSMMAFEMTLHAYYSKKEIRAEGSKIVKMIRNPYVGYNPFRPLVVSTLLPNTEGLIEVDGAVLLAMTSDRVLIRDKKGRRATLREGDRVYLGRLTRIYPEKGRALFRLNEGGMARSVFLSIDFSGEAEEEVSPRAERSAETQVKFLGVEVKDVSDGIQVIITNSGDVPCQYFDLKAPYRIVLDMKPAVSHWRQRRIEVDRGPIRRIRSSQFKRNPAVVRVVIELNAKVSYEITRKNGAIIVKIPKV